MSLNEYAPYPPMRGCAKGETHSSSNIRATCSQYTHAGVRQFYFVPGFSFPR